MRCQQRARQPSKRVGAHTSVEIAGFAFVIDSVKRSYATKNLVSVSQK